VDLRIQREVLESIRETITDQERRQKVTAVTGWGIHIPSHLPPWLGTTPPADFSAGGRVLRECCTSRALATAVEARPGLGSIAPASGTGGAGVWLLGEGIGLCSLRVERTAVPL